MSRNAVATTAAADSAARLLPRAGFAPATKGAVARGAQTDNDPNRGQQALMHAYAHVNGFSHEAMTAICSVRASF